MYIDPKHLRNSRPFDMSRYHRFEPAGAPPLPAPRQRVRPGGTDRRETKAPVV